MNTINFKKGLKGTSLLGLFFLFAITGVTVQSCADLDPDPTEFNLPPESFGSLEEMDSGIGGVYSQVTLAARMTTFYAPAWAGDDMTTHRALNKADFREFDQRAVLSSNSRLLRNWNAIFDAINSINGVLDRSEGLIGLEAVDQNLLQQYIGEAHFLRGILFYQLARVHGRIPLPLTKFPDPNISRSSLEEVYLQIESDLLLAEEKLPAIYPGVPSGASRPNSGSSRAFLARLYMDWGGFPMKDASKYTQAASSALQVMENADSHGFGLVDDLEDLWTLDGRFSKESLYTIAFCKQCPNNDVGNRKFSRLGLPADLGGWNETFAEIKFFEDFPAGPRKDATYRLDLDWQSFNAQKSPVFKKITGPPGNLNPGDFITERNDFIMRYAEILLIYAEASGLSGNVTSNSWEALNKIRRRAAGLPYATPDPSVDITSGIIEDLAFEESKWEFAGEYKRWYDLMRREKVKDVLSIRDNVSGLIPEHNPIIGSLEASNYLAPIPADAVARNPSLAD
ncbi:MAG: RagB/SusD family nutrient uptake outer membrane protein [Algibacter sp.]|uniref:RagB/SusD family nutrient uptake outer membrane protein n=1 Tax=Algibacter sp. TaxID=1872428 RepID=UPI00260E9416|nr:RagB/SusD family nutrient uptake outer membrane protein [Algibacter sp.]MDG1731267.1 RagB/SusD family nutrient uptake outer membrane protein [Algibacter sp.]MDG2178792.1 RagB/SusD family nutrient uptake outer membrane protein [Algibacter sp.]